MIHEWWVNGSIVGPVPEILTSLIVQVFLKAI